MNQVLLGSTVRVTVPNLQWDAILTGRDPKSNTLYVTSAGGTFDVPASAVEPISPPRKESRIARDKRARKFGW